MYNIYDNVLVKWNFPKYIAIYENSLIVTNYLLHQTQIEKNLGIVKFNVYFKV